MNAETGPVRLSTGQKTISEIYEPETETDAEKTEQKLRDRIQIAENFISDSKSLYDKERENWFALKFLQIQEEIEKKYQAGISCFLI